MEQIVTWRMGERERKLFSSFLAQSTVGAPLHRHPYPEVHIFLAGTGEYHVEGAVYPLLEGDVILIPAGAAHSTATAEGSRVMTLQLDAAAEAVHTLRLPTPLVEELAGGAEDRLFALMPALSYLLTRLFPDGLFTVRPNDDSAYLIHEYIGENYHRPLRLSELAAVLHLSERQTQRVIRTVFGVSFSELLTSHRLATAEHLAATTDMTWEAIAAYVGYETYSGFRRALTKRGAAGRKP